MTNLVIIILVLAFTFPHANRENWTPYFPFGARGVFQGSGDGFSSLQFSWKEADSFLSHEYECNMCAFPRSLLKILKVLCDQDSRSDFTNCAWHSANVLLEAWPKMLSREPTDNVFKSLSQNSGACKLWRMAFYLAALIFFAYGGYNASANLAEEVS